MTETKIAALIPIGRPAPALAQRAGTPYARHSRRHLRYGGATPDAAASAHVVPCGAGVGRGAATRTGTAYAREHFGDHTLVTADADGAHKGDEIMRVAGIARENPGTLVLGARVWAQAARRGRNQLRLPRVRQAARARYDGGAARVGFFPCLIFYWRFLDGGAIMK